MPQYVWDGSTKPKASSAPAVDDTTFEARFKAALRDVRRDGVKVKQNVPGCCRSCISYDAFGMTDEQYEATPMVWTYGGQGSAYSWVDGVPVYRNSERSYRGAPMEKIYFNHSGPGVDGARALTKRMREHGIKVEWDGSDGKCPTVIVEET